MTMSLRGVAEGTLSAAEPESMWLAVVCSEDRLEAGEIICGQAGSSCVACALGHTATASNAGDTAQRIFRRNTRRIPRMPRLIRGADGADTFVAEGAGTSLLVC